MAEPIVQRGVRALAHNKGLKVVALVLALVSWFLIHTNISHERLVKDVPVTIRAEEGWAVLDVSAPSAQVLFRGSLNDLRLLEQAPIRLEVDARKASGGRQQVRLTASHVQAAGMARPIYIEPVEVAFVLDQQGEKRVVVKADFQGSPVEECEVTRVVCEPAHVVLHGPRRRLAEMESVHTAPIDLEGRSRPFRKTHVPLALNSATWLDNGTASNVTVHVTIAERAATRTFQDVPVQALLPAGAAGAVRVQPAQVNLTLRGRLELLSAVKREELQAYVEGAALAMNSATVLPVRVFLPPGLEVAAVEPASITARLIR
jgi:YbbR domain-containing protein